jgi:SAM-dependent methyltransferase
VVVSSAAERGRAGHPARAERTPAAVVWHDLECGGYRVDLPLWRELADIACGPILELGAGTGRVALDLARAGHDVTALDRDPILLEALRRRVSGSTVQAVCADARSFTLSRRDYGACLLPMQTLQLLGGAAGRRACMLRAREHLRPGGLLACALLSTLEPFDCSTGQIGPAAERARVDGLLYVSRAIRVSERTGTVVIERERRVLDEHAGTQAARTGGLVSQDITPTATLELDTVELDRVSAGTLEREGRDAGLQPLARRQIPATDEHVGSVVVVLAA